jgi:hypothetical protein
MNIKVILGLIMIIAGVIIGVYIGVWLMFIKGLVQIIEGAKHEPVNAMWIALGIFRVIASSFVGWLSSILLMIPGFVILKKAFWN